jgi:hypothetical protein
MTFRAASLWSLALLSVASVVACSTTVVPAGGGEGAPAAPAPTATTPPDMTNEPPPATMPAGPTCAAPPSKSTCGESAWVRGVAHFDPAKLTGGSKPVLRVALRHAFVLVRGEETIGGRLHGYVSVPIKDPPRGEQAFAIDMCDFGTSMWSEENGSFNLVVIIDENDDNDLDKATTNEQAIVIGTPSKNELSKLQTVDISCNGKSACLDVKVDCTGTSCLTIQPMKSCTKKLPGCKSDSSFCQ